MFNTKKIKEIENRLWKLENPPLLKVGDVHQGHVVCDVVFNESYITHFGFYKVSYSPYYTYYGIKKGESCKKKLNPESHGPQRS